MMRFSRSFGSSSRISWARRSTFFLISSSIVLLQQYANRDEFREDVPELSADLEQPFDGIRHVVVAPRAHGRIVGPRRGTRKLTAPDLPLLVVVTGPPASGKTTVAEALARDLGLPLVAKDAIKERLFDSLGTGDREWSRALGRATFELLFARVAAALREALPVVAEANFDAAAVPAFAALPPSRPLQIHCSAPVDVLLARYAARTPDRHPGHLDGEILEEVRTAIESGRHDPLPLAGELIAVDTSGPVDVDALAARIRALL
jgi:predicted kinase